MKLVSLENLSKYNELLNQKTVKSVNSVKPDSTGNVKLGTEKSTFNKVEYDKYDLDLFCKMLAYVITQNCLSDIHLQCQFDLNVQLYTILVEFEERQRLVNNKQWLFENMMLKMWCAARGLKYAD